MIVSPQHKEAFEEIFHNQLDIRDFNRLPPRLRQYAAQLAQLWRNMAQFCARRRSLALLRYAKKIHETGAKVKLVVQTEQLGLGHAVLTAQQKLTAEPFLLMLGDHLYAARAILAQFGAILDALVRPR